MKFKTLIIVLVVLIGCNSKTALEKEIDAVSVEVKISRFDKAFAEVTPLTLPKLKSEFPVMFSERIPDSVWINRIQDTLQNQINNQVEKVFPSEE